MQHRQPLKTTFVSEPSFQLNEQNITQVCVSDYPEPVSRQRRREVFPDANCLPNGYVGPTIIKKGGTEAHIFCGAAGKCG